MGHRAENRKRLISVTEGNLRNRHLYITGHHDFFPEEYYGQSNAKKGTGRMLTLLVEGLPNTVQTDIARGNGNGHPRNFFRKRDWVDGFFKTHRLQEGDVVAIERLDSFTYRVYPFRNGNQESHTAKAPMRGEQTTLIPKAIELIEENTPSGFGDTAFTRNRQESLHRWAEILFRERGDLA
jgi:hypothetical protein